MKMPFKDKLLTVFFDYLEEVIEIKTLITDEKIESFVNVVAIPVGENPYKYAASGVSDRLFRSLNSMDIELKGAYSSFEYERWLEAKYILAATVDEIFIHKADWKGNKYWLGNLLEQKVNDSRNAGVTIFERITTLLLDKSGEDIFVVLAKLYYFSLQVGFEGKYRNAVETEDNLQSVKDALQRFIGERPLRKNDLFEQRSTNTGAYGRGVRIASMQPWLRMAVTAAVAYVLASSYVWLTSIDSFHRILSQG